MPIDQIVHMVAVRHCFMAASRPMHVVGRMPTARMLGRADVGVDGSHGKHMFVHMIPMRMVQVAVVQIVNMAFVAHGDVAAARAVLVVMVLVVGLGTGCHGDLLGNEHVVRRIHQLQKQEKAPIAP